MELTHRFSVPVPVEEAWAHFNDIASVAECFPGAAVTSADGDSFQGSVKVKLGPIALLYNGSGTFTEKDDVAHRFVVDAKGKDKRGNGTAGAVVTLSMTEQTGDATDVEVLTDLAITGKPAQFGRGVMQDVSDKLLGQFMNCLEQRLAAPEKEDVEAHVMTTVPDDDVSAHLMASTGEVAPLAAVPPAPAIAPATPEAPRQHDALDLGATVLPVLVKSYWKHAVAAFAVIVLLIWLIAAL
jgi:carbon monoxide dehydrogenase subunit G